MEKDKLEDRRRGDARKEKGKWGRRRRNKMKEKGKRVEGKEEKIRRRRSGRKEKRK
jgi:hypothetical protein